MNYSLMSKEQLKQRLVSLSKFKQLEHIQKEIKTVNKYLKNLGKTKKEVDNG